MVSPKHSLIIPLLCLFIINCKHSPEVVKQKYFRMDTVTEVTLVLRDKKQAQQCCNSIDSLLKDWEERFSVEGPYSEVRLLNERKINTMPIGPQLKEMLQFALNYGDTLEGGFDLTVLPLKRLWGFGENSQKDSPLPTEKQIQSALEKVDYRKLKIIGDSLFFSSPETQLDVGGVAKGFVLREIGKLLNSYGINNYLISAGGDIIIKGKRADGKPWRVGIQHPRTNGVLGALELDNGSIVTSGDYERYRIIDGKRYHHIFNPRTGYCATKNQSLTIFCLDPVEADIMSTGLFSINAEEIIEFVNSRPRLECLIVDSCGKVFKSRGWGEKVTIFDEN
jgi:thiamine biosynthesis lipoprotein